jgi:hypothetical protein
MSSGSLWGIPITIVAPYGTYHTTFYMSSNIYYMTNTHNTLPQLHRIVHWIHILPWQLPRSSSHTQTHQVWPTNHHTTKQWMENQPPHYHYHGSKRSYTQKLHKTTNQSKSPKTYTKTLMKNIHQNAIKYLRGGLHYGPWSRPTAV